MAAIIPSTSTILGRLKGAQRTIQRIPYSDSEGKDLILFEGLRAQGAGNIFYASSGDIGRAARVGPLMHIRGEFTPPELIEFYFFRAGDGMKGPFRAKRIDSFP